ncbi:hypothetical protein M8J77_003407 [Diaphorina citri]|nr:hypothetical protein M8J77_003407 [Diaphorina citri]
MYGQDYNSAIALFNHNYNSNSSSSKSNDDSNFPNETKEERRARKRKSRWGAEETDKTFIPGMPTVIPTNLSKDQEQAYLYQLQIEEISRKLRSGDLGIPSNPEERSPSPEPIYSSDGKRMNTREYRTRKKLEEERHDLIQKMFKVNPEFKPPPDYKPPVIKVNDKVMIPQDEHPDINFVGLLIGPRGNTLKSMEKDTGAKIIIRGKGSVKEGKVGRKDGQPLPGENEPLHAYVTAHNPENVKKAVDRIKEIIRQGVEVPEGQNDLRRNQLRELALLNGTLRENEGPRCTNCGASDHKSWLCPDKPNITNSTLCSSCGGAGHIARDCREKRPGMGGPPANTHRNRAKIDEEYMSLMAELGEGPPPDKRQRDNDSYRKNNTSGSLFNNDNMAPRALMAPPPGPPMSTPPQMIPNSLPPPPWNNNSGGNNNMPLINQPPPQVTPPWQQQSSQPPPLMAQPIAPPMNFNTQGNQNTSVPPPPPPRQSNFDKPPSMMNMGNQPNFNNNPSNFNNNPSNFNNNPSNFNMGNYNQMPPPQNQGRWGAPPPPPPPTSGNNNNMNNLPPWQQQSGMMWGGVQNPLSSLLGAPPPPPPPPSS